MNTSNLEPKTKPMSKFCVKETYMSIVREIMKLVMKKIALLALKTPTTSRSTIDMAPPSGKVPFTQPETGTQSNK